MDPNMELEFKLTIAEANLVMEALQELPFKRVAMLVNKINQQADECVAKQNAKKEEKENGDGQQAES